MKQRGQRLLARSPLPVGLAISKSVRQGGVTVVDRPSRRCVTQERTQKEVRQERCDLQVSVELPPQPDVRIDAHEASSASSQLRHRRGRDQVHAVREALTPEYG